MTETEAKGNQGWANMKFPPGFAKPYTLTTEDGRSFEKAIVNIPPGTKANGVDLTGYSTDVFLNSFQKGQIASGEGITCGFPADKKVELFKGKGEQREHIEIDPWALAKAVKAQRESFAAEKAAERSADYSLGAEAKSATAAKDALGAPATDRQQEPKAL